LVLLAGFPQTVGSGFSTKVGALRCGEVLPAGIEDLAEPRLLTVRKRPALVRRHETRSPCTAGRIVMRGVMAAFYIAAGIVHLTAPDAFLPIVPDWVPWPRDVVLATGTCEIAGSVALMMTRRLRHLAGVMLALYAVCVFPANLKHALEGIHVPPLPDAVLHGDCIRLLGLLPFDRLPFKETVDRHDAASLMMIAPDNQQFLAWRSVPPRWAVVNAAVADVHALDDGVPRSATTLDDTSAHATST
jgi:uncharacterized membrane protein